MFSEKLHPIIEQTEKLINDVMDNIESNNITLSQFQLLTHMIFGRSVTSFYSTKLLAKEGYGFDAMVIVRTIVENMIALEYINLEPEYRARQYLNYIHVIKYRRLQDGKKLYGEKLNIPSEQEHVINENYYRLRSYYPNKNSWSGKSIRRMAEEVAENMPWFMSYYLLPYAFSSSYVHGNVDILFNYVEEIESGIKIRGGVPSSKDTDKAVVTAIISLIGIIQRVCELMNCDVPEGAPNLIDEILRFSSAV